MAMPSSLGAFNAMRQKCHCYTVRLISRSYTGLAYVVSGLGGYLSPFNGISGETHVGKK